MDEEKSGWNRTVIVLIGDPRIYIKGSHSELKKETGHSIIKIGKVENGKGWVTMTDLSQTGRRYWIDHKEVGQKELIR